MRPTAMKISVDALAENARAIRQEIPARVRMLCVVKADAYGHGAMAAVHAFGDLADAYAVAIVEEARELRRNGVEKMIVILGGACEESLREAVRVNASQAVYDAAALDVLQDEARRLGTKARAHLKVDTGMSRVGVRGEAALVKLLEHWKGCPDVEMEGIFTHFCVADTDPEYTDRQNADFRRALDRVREAGFHPIAHAAASAAMLDPRYQYDMVRAGIALYGWGVPQLDGRLQYAQQLVTRPIRIETIQAGDTVGYGRAFRAERETVVMTLPVGYGDGYPRLLGNRAEVLVRGRRARVIGRVCMDMLMADVTDIPGVTLQDEVVLMGKQGDARITPAELADCGETIPYEIMLGFLSRVPRVEIPAGAQ